MSKRLLLIRSSVPTCTYSSTTLLPSSGFFVFTLHALPAVSCNHANNAKVVVSGYGGYKL